MLSCPSLACGIVFFSLAETASVERRRCSSHFFVSVRRNYHFGKKEQPERGKKMFERMSYYYGPPPRSRCLRVDVLFFFALACSSVFGPSRWCAVGYSSHQVQQLTARLQGDDQPLRATTVADSDNKANAPPPQTFFRRGYGTPQQHHTGRHAEPVLSASTREEQQEDLEKKRAAAALNQISIAPKVAAHPAAERSRSGAETRPMQRRHLGASTKNTLMIHDEQLPDDVAESDPPGAAAAEEAPRYKAEEQQGIKWGLIGGSLAVVVVVVIYFVWWRGRAGRRELSEDLRAREEARDAEILQILEERARLEAQIEQRAAEVEARRVRVLAQEEAALRVAERAAEAGFAAAADEAWRERTAGVLQGTERAAAAQADVFSREAQLRQEAVRRQMEGQLRNAEGELERAHADLKTAMTRLQDQQGEVQDVAKASFLTARQRAEEHLVEAALRLRDDVKTVVDAGISDMGEEQRSATTTSGQMPDSSEAVRHMPPLSVLIQGFLAPAMLRTLMNENKFQLWLFCPVLLLMSIAAGVDSGRSCGDEWLWAWVWTMIAFLVVIVVVRIAVQVISGWALQKMSRESEGENGTAGGWLETFTFCSKVLEGQSKEFLNVLETYDSIKDSWLLTMARILVFAAYLWGGYGVYLTLSGAHLNMQKCEAVFVRRVVHALVFIYLLTFGVGLVVILGYAVQLALAKISWLERTLISSAMSFDDQLSPGKFPVLLFLVRALVLRPKSDMKRLEIQVLRNDIERLKAAREEADKRTLEVEEELAAKMAQRLAAEVTNDEEEFFVETEAARLEKAIDDSSALIGFATSVASQVYGEPAPAVAPATRRASAEFEANRLAARLSQAAAGSSNNMPAA